MSESDFDAMCELASELSTLDAIQLIRSETGCGLSECRSLLERIAADFPQSPLGINNRKWTAA